MIVEGRNVKGVAIPQAMGDDGEVLASELHGKWYAAARRGQVFIGATAAAGTTIPVSSATAATFTLYNPIGSGVNLELITYRMAIAAATLVVSPILLGIARGLTVGPTGLTALTSGPALIGGGGGALGKLYSVATIVATTEFFPMFNVSAVAGVLSNCIYQFDGEIMLAPGSLVHVCGTAAQASAAAQGFTWAEWKA